jgi:hypothetical protein
VWEHPLPDHWDTGVSSHLFMSHVRASYWIFYGNMGGIPDGLGRMDRGRWETINLSIVGEVVARVLPGLRKFHRSD